MFRLEKLLQSAKRQVLRAEERCSGQLMFKEMDEAAQQVAILRQVQTAPPLKRRWRWTPTPSMSTRPTLALHAERDALASCKPGGARKHMRCVRGSGSLSGDASIGPPTCQLC